MYKRKQLLSEEQIQNRVTELAAALNREYKSKTLDIVCILKGALFFVADLMRQLEMPTRLHFVQVSSYGTGTTNSGMVSLHYSSDVDLARKHVLLVEDILDTGITLDYLVKHLKEKRPKSLKICALLVKPDRHRIDVSPDFFGFQILDDFVIGYGLDYREFGRNLRYIATLDPKEYKKRP